MGLFFSSGYDIDEPKMISLFLPFQVVSVAESTWLPLSVLPTQCRTDSVPVFVEKSADAILTTSGVEEDRFL